MSSRGTFSVVVCHGSYHTPEPYQPFLEALRAKGVEAHCPQLPTSDLRLMNVGDLQHPDYDREIPKLGYPQPADDALVINELLIQLIVDESKHVLLVGHSSGGFVATQVAIPELQAKNRVAKGEAGGIIGIFYASGFLIPVGESVHSFFQPKDGSPAVVPPYCEFHSHGMEGVASAVDGAKFFFNGLDEATAKHYGATLTASPIFTTVLNNNAYATVPCAYLVCEEDMALPATYQDGMIGMHQASGVDIKVYRCPSGHSPHLAWKDGMVTTLIEFGREITT